jgi:hypothetical protein
VKPQGAASRPDYEERIMMAANLALATRVHTGPWEVFPRLAGATRALRRTVLDTSRTRVRLYYLMDGRGRQLGVITAPSNRPELGPHAPTVYLRRTA